jgi:hypothetical protein
MRQVKGSYGDRRNPGLRVNWYNDGEAVAFWNDAPVDSIQAVKLADIINFMQGIYDSIQGDGYDTEMA